MVTLISKYLSVQTLRAQGANRWLYEKGSKGLEIAKLSLSERISVFIKGLFLVFCAVFEEYRLPCKESWIQVYTGICIRVIHSRIPETPEVTTSRMALGQPLVDSPVLLQEREAQRVIQKAQDIWLSLWMAKRPSLLLSTQDVLPIALVRHSLKFVSAHEGIWDRFVGAIPQIMDQKIKETEKRIKPWFSPKPSERVLIEMKRIESRPKADVELFQFVYTFLDIGQRLKSMNLRLLSDDG